MTEPLLVPTHFTTTDELAMGLAERVDEGRLMLYGPAPYADGDWVQFTVLLADQNVGLNGVGRATASIDGGAERPEAARWDLVLDSLSFDEATQPVYASMLEARRDAFGDAQPEEGGDVVVDDEVPDEPVYEVDEHSTGAEMVVGDGEGLVESVVPSEPAAPSPSLPPPPHGGVLLRPTKTPVWRPLAPIPPSPRMSSGSFVYGPGELPAPPAAPRGDLEADQRIAPAPRPAAPADG